MSRKNETTIFQFEEQTLFNDSSDLSLKGSWIGFLVRTDLSDGLGEQLNHIEVVGLLEKRK